jgi:hypothetical protein
MFYAATRSNSENTSDSIKLGLLAAVACFVFIGMLQFRDGPFVRPSVPIWRAVLSLSVLYQLFLVFLLFLVRIMENGGPQNCVLGLIRHDIRIKMTLDNSYDTMILVWVSSYLKDPMPMLVI